MDANPRAHRGMPLSAGPAIVKPNFEFADAPQQRPQEQEYTGLPRPTQYQATVLLPLGLAAAR